MLIANARMYSVEPISAGAWRALVAWVATEAGVPLRVVELGPGEPLGSLWRRDDLGCALMCGYPWATWDAAARPRPRLLAVPVPAAPEGGRRPEYRTCIVARASGPLRTADDLPGVRFAFTLPASQSGYQAPRRWLADRGPAPGGRWFAQAVGPLVTPRGVVDAILEGDADAGPLDSYWLDLLRLHEPATAAHLRVVAITPWTPAPPFVCSAGVDQDVRGRLSAALVAAGRAAALVEVRATLALADVAKATPATYAVLAARARESDALGYPVLQ